MNLSIRKLTLHKETLRSVGTVALLATAALALACGPTPESPSAANTTQSGTAKATPASPGNTATTSVDDAGLCANDYYPVDTTLAREYRLTGTAPASFTLTQENETNSGFAEVRSFGDGLTVRNNWVCTEEGLRNAEYTNAMTMKDAQFEMETLKSSGVTLPREWMVGSEWATEYDVVAKMAAGPVKANADGRVLVTNKLVSLDDQVVIDGKDFSAAKVETTIEIDLTMNGRRINSAKVNATNWFAKDIGILKQTAKSTFGSQTVEFIGTK